MTNSSRPRLSFGVFCLLLSGCVSTGGDGPKGGCDGRARLDGYTFLDVDSTTYEPAIQRVVASQSFPSCTAEALASPDSPFSSPSDCYEQTRLYERERGYLYRVCGPADSLLYVLSRAPVAPGPSPLPDTAATRPPEPGFERISLGATYRLNLNPLRVRANQPLGYDDSFRPPLPIYASTPEDVSQTLYDRYRPLGSDALFGRYIRTGLRVDTLASSPGR